MLSSTNMSADDIKGNHWQVIYLLLKSLLNLKHVNSLILLHQQLSFIQCFTSTEEGAVLQKRFRILTSKL